MIPEKEKKADKIQHKEKGSSFAFFDIVGKPELLCRHAQHDAV